MKLICPPKNWQNPVEIKDSDVNLLQTVAERLGLVFTRDDTRQKVYLGCPEADLDKEEPCAFFVTRLPRQSCSAMIDGCLILDGKEYKACSGLPQRQVFDEYFDRYCPIPPGKYEIDLAWYVCETSGIEGPYYHITPDPIIDPSGSGKKRTEIGLHKDNGAIGTAGCIGIVGQDWERLHRALQGLAKVRKKLKLEVNYLCRD